MIAPDPHATRAQNLVATMLQHGCIKSELNVARIAHHQDLNADELAAEFDRQEAARLTRIPSNSDHGSEGK